MAQIQTTQKTHTWTVGVVAHSLASVAVLVLCVGPSTPSAVAYASEIELTHAGDLLAGWNAVAISGTYAICALNHGLVVLDVSNPSSPRRVAQLSLDDSYDPPLPGGSLFSTAEQVVVYGHHAYVIGSRIAVVDILDPIRPQLLHLFDVAAAGSPSGFGPVYGRFVIAGSMAYLPWHRPGFPCEFGWCGAGWGVAAFDLSDPSDPQIVSARTIVSAPTLSLLASDQSHLFAVGEGGVMILDIVDPLVPDTLGVYPITGDYSSVVDLEVQRDFAFLVVRNPLVACTLSGARLLVLDVSDRGRPDIAGSLELPGCDWDVQVSGDLVCLVQDEHSLRFLDISHPWSPVLSSAYPLPSRIGDIVSEGSLAFVPDYQTGLHALDVTDPDAPRLVGRHESLRVPICKFVAQDQHLFVPHETGFQIVDATDAASLRIVSDYTTAPGTINRCPESHSPGVLAVRGDYLYTSTDSGFQIVDITDVASPNLVSTYNAGGHVSAGTVHGSRVYLSGPYSRLHIVDVSNPARPQTVSTTPLFTRARAMVVSGTRLVASIYERVLVWDISDIHAPVQLGTHSLAYYDRISDMWVDGNLVYLSSELGLRILDISTPDSIRLIGSNTRYRDNLDVVVSGRFAYLASSSYGGNVIVMDIADPFRPVEVAEYAGARAPSSLVLDPRNEHVYVADEYRILTLAADIAYLRGDADEDGRLTIRDILRIANFVFKGGTTPYPIAVAGDANCDGGVSAADILYLIEHVFKGGEPPCAAL